MRVHVLVGFLVTALLVAGCGGAGYQDEALLKQATRSLNRITGALEQYRAESKSYPPEGSDLGVKLEKYFVSTDTAGNVTNDWPEMVSSSFRGEIEYETPDSVYSYFLKVKALDSRNTPLTARSNRQPEEKKKKRRRR